jgi:EAL domain-containing protein (putative c-di-GMP-specific phosphodiesterase class I)
VAINGDFRHEADPENQPVEQLNLFEADLRSDFAAMLSAVLDASVAAAGMAMIDLDHARDALVLKDLLAAITQSGKAGLSFDHEKVLPVSAWHDRLGFQEALIRVRGESGGMVAPKKLFDALSNPCLAPDLASSFRLWLTFAAIREFHAVPRSMGLSVNIVPRDLDSPAYRESFERGLDLFEKCGYTPLILEATEYDPWTPQRLSFLEKMVKKYGLALAIDDYGAPEGYNQATALADFTKAIPPGCLIVKVDGQVVMDFLQNRNMDLIDRLREIRALCPSAIVIAEWVPGVKDTRQLLERLRPYGLDDLIGLVQSFALQNETPSSFLGKMGLRENNAGPA